MNILTENDLYLSMTANETALFMAQMSKYRHEAENELKRELGEDASRHYTASYALMVITDNDEERFFYVVVNYYYCVAGGQYRERIVEAEEYKTKNDLLLIVKLETLLNEAVNESY